jgi:hypothetical protein
MLEICSWKTEPPANWLTKESIKYALHRVRRRGYYVFTTSDTYPMTSFGYWLRKEINCVINKPRH